MQKASNINQARGLKVCKKCGTEKALEDFHRDRSRPDGRQPRCKLCHTGAESERYAQRREARLARRRDRLRTEPAWRDNLNEKKRQWSRANRASVKASAVRCKYGITYEEYQEKLRRQEGRCAICFRPASEVGTLHIDHSHETGQVLGLLCGGCNVGLGMFGHEIGRLRSAISYVELYYRQEKNDQSAGKAAS